MSLSSGGGISNNAGRATLFNSTLSGNVATGGSDVYNGGGAIDSFGGFSANVVTLNFCTVTGNNSPNAAGGTRAGLWAEGGMLSLSNTIVAGNGAQDVRLDGGALQSGGFNLIGKAGGHERLYIQRFDRRRSQTRPLGRQRRPHPNSRAIGRQRGLGRRAIRASKMAPTSAA